MRSTAKVVDCSGFKLKWRSTHYLKRFRYFHRNINLKINPSTTCFHHTLSINSSQKHWAGFIPTWKTCIAKYISNDVLHMYFRVFIPKLFAIFVLIMYFFDDLYIIYSFQRPFLKLLCFKNLGQKLFLPRFQYNLQKLSVQTCHYKEFTYVGFAFISFLVITSTPEF